jgi:hypothetical protein
MRQDQPSRPSADDTDLGTLPACHTSTALFVPKLHKVVIHKTIVIMQRVID